MTEVLGDGLYKLCKLLPLEAVMNSIMFNQELLKQMARYRVQNELGKGDPIITDEEDAMNGKADLQWTIIHIVVCWFILLVFIEYRIPCLFCYPASRIRQVDQEDNDLFFGKEEDSDLERYDGEDDGESSEIP